jgi:hypothetical protein
VADEACIADAAGALREARVGCAANEVCPGELAAVDAGYDAGYVPEGVFCST